MQPVRPPYYGYTKPPQEQSNQIISNYPPTTPVQPMQATPQYGAYAPPSASNLPQQQYGAHNFPAGQQPLISNSLQNATLEPQEVHGPAFNSDTVYQPGAGGLNSNYQPAPQQATYNPLIPLATPQKIGYSNQALPSVPPSSVYPQVPPQQSGHPPRFQPAPLVQPALAPALAPNPNPIPQPNNLMMQQNPYQPVIPSSIPQIQHQQSTLIGNDVPQPSYNTIPSSSRPILHPQMNTIPPTTAVDHLTGKMQNLSTSTTLTTTSQPVGIIGQNLPLEDIYKEPLMAIQPALDPAYFRVTLNKIPRTAATLHKTRLPFGLTVTPYPVGGGPVPVIDGPIVRCRRCRTYLNPYVEMIDQGAKWRCNLCFLDNEFPANYDYDANTQQYLDRRSKAELHAPVYEFVAPIEYMVRPPQPPVYLFLLDVSYYAISLGVLPTAARILLDALDNLPNTHDRTRIGIMTFDTTIHFYHLAPSNDEPRMMVVADLEDTFLPCAEDLLVGLSEAREIIEKLLGRLGSIFSKTQIVASALGPALSTAVKLMTPIGGKIVIVQAGLPSLGDGKIINREDAAQLGTSKENGMLQPAHNSYKSLATEASRHQICIDMFLFPTPYLDVATIGCAAKFTGGKIFLYPDFVASNMEAVEKFAGEMTAFLKDEIGLEAVIRIRASQGVSLNAYHGSFFLRSTDLLALPNVNSRHSYSAQVVIDENITSSQLCFQTAVLHTNCQGERRIRVINAAFTVSDDHREIFLHADLGAMTDLLLKMAAEKVLANRLEDARDALVNKMNDILLAIKNIFQSGQNPQLMVTENLRLLPLLMLAILKSPVVRGGKLTSLDYRSYILALVKTFSVPNSLYFLHPFMFAVHTMPNEAGLPNDSGDVLLPPPLHLGSDTLERHGLYVLYDGMDFYIWLGSQVHPELCQLIFGQPYEGVKVGKMNLPTLDNPWSRRVHSILSTLQRKHQSVPNTIVVREDSDPALKGNFLLHLIEDKSCDGQPSYAAWAATLRDKIYSVGGR